MSDEDQVGTLGPCSVTTGCHMNARDPLVGGLMQIRKRRRRVDADRGKSKVPRQVDSIYLGRYKVGLPVDAVAWHG